MNFKYTALSPTNQKLEGVLEAESIDAARNQLHKMGLSVVAINEVTAEEAAAIETKKESAETKASGIQSFYFIAKDTQGKEINGTIDAKEASSAYRRLLTEYQFEVLDLYPENAADPAAESLKGKFEEWNQQLEDEGIDLSSESMTGGKAELEEGKAMNEEVVKEIDSFIISIKKVISDFADNYSEAQLREIEDRLGALERIRSSNNLGHITKLCNDLYALISNPDSAQTDEEGAPVSDDYQETLSELQGSGFVTNRFQSSQLNALKRKLESYEPVKKVMEKVGKVFHRNKPKVNQPKKKKNPWFAKLKRRLRGRKGSGPNFIRVVTKLFAFLGAPNSILRRARKQEFFKTLKNWKEGRKQAKATKAAEKAAEKAGETVQAATGETDEPQLAPAETEIPDKPKKDFSGLFMELDSFVGWLLFFYITYFFLASFAIERNIGIPAEIILKTLSTPLIVNIAILLLITHFAFTLKVRFFRTNFLGSFFLFLLCLGAYTLTMVNF